MLSPTGFRHEPMSFGVWIVSALAALISFSSAPAIAGETELISARAYTGEAAGDSLLEGPRTMSADGRYVVFLALKYGLVPGDTNRHADIFMRDRWLATTRRVSVASDGTQSNGHSFGPAISADGRYVVFGSDASNLVPGSGVPGPYDIYLHDTMTRRTELITVPLDGQRANGSSGRPTVSDDGRYVAFMSIASNLVEQYVNGRRSVYVRDRQAGRTELIDEGEAYSVAISGNGRYVAFETDAAGTTTSHNVYVRDRTTGVRELISVTPSGNPGRHGGRAPSITADGRFVAFGSWSPDLVSDDSNGGEDIFVRDRQLGSTSRISLDSSGGQLVRGADSGFGPAISADGRFVTFVSNDLFVVPGDSNGSPDAFVRDTLLQQTLLATVSSAGQQGSSLNPITCAISDDGRFVAFDSYSSEFVANDFNLAQDVFVHDFEPQPSTFGFAVKPTALAFGNQALFTSTTLSVWVTNKGTTELPIASVGLLGLNPGTFSADNRCGSAVAVGASCSISVTFRPTSVGDKSAKLRVVAGDNDVRSEALAGKGIRSPFTVSPTSLDFGSVPIGTMAAAKVVTISNTGSAVLPISSIALGGLNPYQFAQTHNCPATLAVGASCTINVVFKPAATSSKAALVQITPGSGSGALRSVALAGAAR